MILELRRYSIVAGGMADMHKRMRDLLIPLFAETGVPYPIAVWAGEDGAGFPVLSWILTWESYEQRRSIWPAVAPRWARIKAERGGDEFVTQTELTLIEPWLPDEVRWSPGTDACEAAWHIQPQVGAGAAVRAACIEEWCAMLRDADRPRYWASICCLARCPRCS